jgi:hypothetical protein
MPTTEQMEDALMERVKRDDPENFDPDGWKDVRLGFTYDDDEELVDIAIFETTDGVVRAEGKFMPDPVWHELIDRVNADDNAGDAIDPMMDAALQSKPLPANDEGFVTGRPPQRPTLKRRD